MDKRSVSGTKMDIVTLDEASDVSDEEWAKVKEKLDAPAPKGLNRAERRKRERGIRIKGVHYSRYDFRLGLIDYPKGIRA